MKKQISDYFWPLGVSLLCGWFGLYAATLFLFAMGIPITRWHGLAYLVSAFVGAFLTFKEQKIQQIRGAFATLFIQLCLCGVLTGIASRLDELTVDGMRHRTEAVINLMAGWNILKDKEFLQRRALELTNPYLKGGHLYESTSGMVLASYLACFAGEVNGGKAITPILGIMAFGIAFGGLVSLGISRGWASALAALAAMNPVTIYQSSSYYVDGHVAALFTAALFSGVRFLSRPGNVLSLGIFFVSLGILAAAKTSGILYGGFLFFVIILIWFWQNSEKKRVAATIVFLSLCCVVLFLFFRGQGGFSKISIHYLRKAAAFDEKGNGYSFRVWAPGLGIKNNPTRVEIFFRSHFAATGAMAEEPVFMKFPFWLNRRELAVFEDLSPQPYVGGFGPLYGAFFILSAFSLVLIRRRPPLISWLPLVASFGSIYFSQIWWARWTPQAWLIPLGFLLPVICSLQGQPPGKWWFLPLLAIFVGLLNSILILAFYTSGCIKSQLTLESQLKYLKTLSQPLQVFMPDYPSNRIFFIRENINFIITDRLPPPPRLKIHRTTTEVALPAGTDLSKSIDPAILENLKKRKLIEF